MKKLLSWLVNIILIWLLLLVVSLFMLPHFLNWRFDTVVSGSMEPAMPLGGVIFSMPVEPEEIVRGDIITYHSGSRIIAHRVVDIINEGSVLSFYTKGDANDTEDLHPIQEANVTGKVVFTIPHLGYFNAFVHSRLGFIVTIIVPGVVIIGLELRNIWRVFLREKSLENS